MLDTLTLRSDLAALLPELADRYGVRSLAVFGSCARGEQGDGSDVDLLVEFDQVPGLIRFIEVEQFLEERLGCPVDLATRAMIGPDLATGVTRDLLPV